MDTHAHNKMSEKMKDLTAQAGEMIITHDGQHPQHLSEVYDKFQSLCEGLNVPFTAETMNAMFTGAKLYSEFTEEDEDAGSMLLATFLIVRKQLTSKKTVPVKSNSKETKIPVKPVKPTKSTIQPKDLK